MPSTSLDYSNFETEDENFNLNTSKYNTPNYSYNRTRKQPKKSQSVLREKKKMRTFMLEAMSNESDSDDEIDYNDNVISNENYQNINNSEENMQKYLNSYKPPSGIINPPNNIQNSSDVTESMTNPINYNSISLPHHLNNGTNDNIMLEKMNYIIELLEDQKEEKTGHVGEELILYSFLGIFMIFVVDSFSKNGKYIR